MNEDQWVWTLSEFIAGRATTDSRRAVEEALANDERVRQIYVDLLNLEEGLGRCAESHWLEKSEGGLPLEEASSRRSLRGVWMGTAAGIVLGGILSASMVWAFTGARWEAKGECVTVGNPDFELGEAPQTEGVPSVPGLWGGDYSEITGAHGGLTPVSGRHMLRFLRADNQRTPSDSPTAVSEVWQWVKVEQCPAPQGRRVAAVELSARFNTLENTVEEQVAFGVSLWAFNADVAEGPALWREHRALALASGSREELADKDSSSWQTVSTRLSVPAEARLILVGLRVGRKGTGEKSPVFGAHYVDDVRVRVVETHPRDPRETLKPSLEKK